MKSDISIFVIEENYAMRKKIEGLLYKMKEVAVVCQSRSVETAHCIGKECRPNILMVDAALALKDPEAIYALMAPLEGTDLILMDQRGEAAALAADRLERDFEHAELLEKKHLYEEFSNFIRENYGSKKAGPGRF